MFSWVVRRKVERTSAPQPVYPAQVDAQVQKWIPAIVGLAACFVTPARAKLDVRYYEWAPSPSSWIQVNLPVGPTVAQMWPAVEAGTQRSYRTPDRAKLDVRAYRWDSDFGYDDSGTTAIWTPVNNQGGERTRDRQSFDVRRYDWAPSSAWIFQNLPPAVTVAQTWPAISQGTQNNYRTPARASLDVRGYEWRSDPPFATVTAPTVAKWAPVFSSQLANFRTTDRARLDPRGYEWRSDPSFALVAATPVSAWAPVFSAELASYRVGARAPLDVRTYDWSPQPAWIFTSIPQPATTAQIWPAIEQNLGRQYQTPRRAPLDVRSYDWAPQFISPARLVDLLVAKWIPAFDAELASTRTDDRRRLDVRTYDWMPEQGWITANTPIPPPAAFGFGHRDGTGIDQGATHGRSGPITRASGGRSG